MFKTLSQRLPSMSKSTFADSVDQDQTAHNVQSDLYLLCLIIRVLCLEKNRLGFLLQAREFHLNHLVGVKTKSALLFHTNNI